MAIRTIQIVTCDLCQAETTFDDCETLLNAGYIAIKGKDLNHHVCISCTRQIVDVAERLKVLEY